MSKKYLFHSERLGFRNWSENDLAAFAAMNADKAVMKYFPKQLTLDESKELMYRLQKQYQKWGYTYFAVDTLETNEFIGFIGLAYKDFESEFTPAVDIGWRLRKNVWGKGYATEGATRCLAFAFEELNLTRVIATCTANNSNSEKVMLKAGMKKIGEFIHPNLKDFPHLQKCLCYEAINKSR